MPRWPVLLLALVGVLVGGIWWLRESLLVEYTYDESRPLKRVAPLRPGLKGRAEALPETPAGRGEAEAKEGEAWFEAYSIEEELADAEPEVVAGRVLDSEGKPLGEISVAIAFDDDGPPDAEWDGDSSSTDDDGWFYFSDLPDRVFRVTAAREIPLKRDWRKGRPLRGGEVEGIERVVVEGVAAGRRDVRIRMTPRMASETEWTAKIRVLAPDGTDVPAWSYTECSHGRPWSSIEGWVTPEPGKPGILRFYGPPPFGLIVHGPATREEYESLPYAPGFIYPIVPREEPYVVKLRREGRIRGHVDLGGVAPTASVVVRYAILTNGRAEDPELAGPDVQEMGAFQWDMTGTEEDGSFEIDGLPPGRVRVIPVHPNANTRAAANSAGMTVKVGSTDVRLRLPSYGRITGRIDWEAVKDARELSFTMHVRRRDGASRPVVWHAAWTAEHLAKKDGRFASIILPRSDTYDVEVWADGGVATDPEVRGPIASRRIQHVEPGGSELFVLLKQLPSMRGRLVHADGSSVGRGVEVRAITTLVHPIVLANQLDGSNDFEFPEPYTLPEPRVLPPPGREVWYANTDAEGRFEFQALPPGPYIVWTPELGGAVLRDPPAQAGAQDVLLQLRPTKRITGRVRVRAGALGEGFLVQARDADAPATVLSSSAVRSDGYFELRGLAPGDYRVSVHNARDPGDARAVFVPRIAAGSRRVALTLARGNSVAGLVLDGRGGPARGARVHVTATEGADQRLVLTGQDGRFRVGGLLHAEYWLRVELPDGRRTTRVVSGASEDVRIVVP